MCHLFGENDRIKYRIRQGKAEARTWSDQQSRPEKSGDRGKKGRRWCGVRERANSETGDAMKDAKCNVSGRSNAH